LTKEEVNNRNNNRIKLTNLPFGTSARDLTDITRAINAKACYIPRSTNYKLKPFAILFFEKADDLNDALKLNYAYGGNNLAWVSVETKCCHKCDDPTYLALKCPKIPKKTPTDNKEQTQNHVQKINKLYNKYKPAGHRRPTRSDSKGASSYADMAKKNQTKPNQPKPTETNTSVDKSKHNPNNTQDNNMLMAINKKLDTIVDNLAALHKSVNALQDRITRLEK